MPFVPETTTDDHFHYIIRIPQYYYSKYFKLFLNVHVLISVYYFSMLFYNLFYNYKSVREEDIFFGALILEVLITKVTMDALHPKLIAFNRDIRPKFWSNNNLQIDIKTEMIFFNSLLLLIVVTIAITLVLVVAIPMTLPRCVYNENWSVWFKTTYKIGSFLYFLSCFYMTITSECYCTYTTLHNRFQMKLLIKYIKREMGNYERMQLLHKFHSDLYQEEVRQILIRSIKHYQLLKIYTENIVSVFSAKIFLHFVVGATIISIGVHSVVFNTSRNVTIIIAIILSALVGALLLAELGELTIKTCNEFCTALTEIEWYTFKKSNRNLYFMFICYSQRYSVVTILTNTTTDRALLMQFLRTIYSSIAVLKSVKT